MTGDLEEVEASYLQHSSFVGQCVVVPAVGDSPAITGRLSDVAVYRTGPAARLVGCPTGAVHPERLHVGAPHFEVYLGGQVVTLAPLDVVLVEPLPATPVL
ncbi:hypothetical protein ACFWGN_16280 [Oerskovia sp. NPDC060338]|uniref:hypothetical protein n=1 Tax=Oerskovia sp. NPDC060338 TaxID=3347100 RepID=UPI003668AEDE